MTYSIFEIEMRTGQIQITQILYKVYCISVEPKAGVL